MIDSFMRWLARISLYHWVALCVTATVVLLVLLDWSQEQTWWSVLSHDGMPTPDIVLGLAFAWVRSGTFWFWILAVGVSSWLLWRYANR
jgi:hypothetical protein